MLAALAVGGYFAGREMNARLRYVPPEVLAARAPATPPAARAQVQAEANAEQALRTAAQTLTRARRQEQAAPAANPAARALAPGRAAETPYQVVFREKDLNTLLRTHPAAKKALQRFGVESAVVHLKPGRLRVGALVHLPPLPGVARDASAAADAPLYVEAEGDLTLGDAGRLAFHPAAVRVGKVDAPAAVRCEVEKRLSDVLARARNGVATSRLPGRVKEVRLEDGRIVLNGVVPARRRSSNAPPRRE